ncbi:alpha/beta hydrolase [Bacillus sp. 1NLA3E]|uniref:alpha/beta hydrolase n=1 Tax=Bacillus sp. 1NLA3E TaxID=666686 RepID=UPI000247EE47|nr:alpha/beta fold hydrolase [Bacillus sp. 1NLA3E]AGK55631.1 monoacylglycerol lipase [Bacillus sp. 1NLA3E]
MNEVKSKVIAGAEPFLFIGNGVGILLSHGFLGTPQSVRELGKLLNKFGFTVYAPRLSGHGTSIYDIEEAKYSDWLKDLEAGYLKLKETCHDVFIVGQSMGGALCLQLAAKFPDIKGVLTINAALHVPAYDQYRNGNGPRFVAEGAPDIKDPQAFEITYDSVPISAIHELQKVIEATADQLKNVHTPILVFTSKLDHVVPPSDSRKILQDISSKFKQQIVLENSFHVASLDFDKGFIAKSCYEFIKKFTNN